MSFFQQIFQDGQSRSSANEHPNPDSPAVNQFHMTEDVPPTMPRTDGRLDVGTPPANETSMPNLDSMDPAAELDGSTQAEFPSQTEGISTTEDIRASDGFAASEDFIETEGLSGTEDRVSEEVRVENAPSDGVRALESVTEESESSNFLDVTQPPKQDLPSRDHLSRAPDSLQSSDVEQALNTEQAEPHMPTEVGRSPNRIATGETNSLFHDHETNDSSKRKLISDLSKLAIDDQRGKKDERANNERNLDDSPVAPDPFEDLKMELANQFDQLDGNDRKSPLPMQVASPTQIRSADSFRKSEFEPTRVGSGQLTDSRPRRAAPTMATPRIQIRQIEIVIQSAAPAKSQPQSAATKSSQPPWFLRTI